MADIFIEIFAIFCILSLAILLFEGLFYGLALIAIWMDKK